MHIPVAARRLCVVRLALEVTAQGGARSRRGLVKPLPLQGLARLRSGVPGIAADGEIFRHCRCVHSAQGHRQSSGGPCSPREGIKKDY